MLPSEMFSKMLLCGIAAAMLCTAASAQIYESKDAQGNTVFSDKPSQGAEEVKLSPTNTAVPPPDRPTPALEVTPDPPRQRAVRHSDDDTSADDEEREDGEDDNYYYGDYGRGNDDVEERRRHRQERREQRPHVEPHRSGSPPGGGLRGR